MKRPSTRMVVGLIYFIKHLEESREEEKLAEYKLRIFEGETLGIALMVYSFVVLISLMERDVLPCSLQHNCFGCNCFNSFVSIQCKLIF